MSASIPVDDLRQATLLIAQVHLQLSQQGYPDGVIEMGTNRAYGMAEWHTKDLSPDIRGRAFLQTLAGELSKVEPWCKKQLAYIQ